MTPELNKNEGLPDGAEPDATQRIRTGAAEQPEATEPEETRTVFSSLREAYERARDGRKRGQPEKQSRTAKSVDRSKGLLLLAVAVIIMIFVFLGMFSSSSGTKDRAANQNETESRQAGYHGDRSGRKPRVGDAAAECGYERAGWEQRSTQRR